jgi:hypothetical protein
MSLIKKIDVEAHFAARRAMRLGRTAPMNKLGANWIKSAGKSKKVLAPAGALSLGHSSPGVSPASIPPAPDSRPNSLLRPPGSRRQW